MTPSHPSFSSPCLLLTATIQVKQEMVLTARRDTRTRFEDYKAALKKWIACPHVSTIVFAENSNYDLSELREITNKAAGKDVEFLSFQCPEFDGSLGKGYGEMLILEHCLRRSRLLANTRRFVKVTGRYYLQNASELLDFVGARPDAGVICDMLLNLSWADSRAFGGDADFLRSYLCPMLDQLNDTAGSTFEHVLARAAHRLMADRGTWALPPFSLQVQGTSGSRGHAWGDSPLPKLKRQMRQAILAKLLSSGPR